MSQLQDAAAEMPAASKYAMPRYVMPEAAKKQPHFFVGACLRVRRDRYIESLTPTAVRPLRSYFPRYPKMVPGVLTFSFGNLCHLCRQARTDCVTSISNVPLMQLQHTAFLLVSSAAYAVATLVQTITQ